MLSPGPWLKGNDVARFQQMLPLVERVWRAGCRLSYVYDTAADVDDPSHQALGVAPRLDDNGNPLSGGLDDARARTALVEILRSGHWPGELHLEIHGRSGYPGTPLAFWTTPTGKARQVVEPTASDEDYDPGHAASFVTEWNNTAG